MNATFEPKGEIRTLTVKKGDVIVLSTPMKLSWDAAKRIREIMETEFKGHQVVILDGGTSLEVLRTTNEENKQ